jgi:RNA polymerase sigma-70 factor (ECF subfamily)
MDESKGEAEFIRELTKLQNKLFAYIFTLVPWRQEAENILQETNVVMWQKRHEFEPGTSLSAWGHRIAHNQVLAYRRDCARRNKKVVFDDELIGLLSDQAKNLSEHADKYVDALQLCLKTLSDESRRLLFMRYWERMGADSMAEEMQRSAGALRTLLFRIRQQLRDCINRRLANGDSSSA